MTAVSTDQSAVAPATDDPETPFEDFLQALSGGLTEQQIGQAFDRVLAGEVPDVQIGAFLFGLRVKGETTAQVHALADALLRAAPPLELTTTGPVLDIVGTGGDRTGAISISTPASVLVAAAAGSGTTVVKHGNRGASSPTGSADVVEAWGVPLDLDPQQVAAVAQKAGITFAFAPRFHSAMRHVAPARRGLNVPTVMNVLGPLINPASPTHQLVGVADPSRVELVSEVFRARGRDVLVVRGQDGLDKLTLSGPTDMTLVSGGATSTFTLSPEDVGLDRVPTAELRGSDATGNADRLGAVLRGQEQGPVTEIVLLNAAAACVLLDGVPADDFPDRLAAQITTLREVLASGTAGATLDTWVAAAQSV